MSFNETEEISFISDENNNSENLKTLIFGSNGVGKTNLVLAFVYCFRKMGYYDNGMDHFLRDEDVKRIEGKVYAEGSDNNEITRFVLEAKNGPMDVQYELSLLSETGEVSNERIGVSSSENGEEIASMIRKGRNYTEYKKDGERFSGVLDESMVYETMISKPFEMFTIAIAYHSFKGLTVATYDFDHSVVNSLNFTLNKKVMTRPGILDRVSEGLEEITGFSVRSVESIPFDSNYSFFLFDDGIHYIDGGKKTDLVFYENGFERGRMYEELSSGTKRILYLLLMVESVVNQYYTYDLSSNELISELDLHPMCTLVVDEVGYSLHPAIIRKMIDYIDSTYNFVPLQLIYTVHNTEMMAFEKIPYDQLYLIDKDEKGSFIRCLKDINGIEMCGHGINLKNAYLEGRFGFVPKFRNYQRMTNDS